MPSSMVIDCFAEIRTPFCHATERVPRTPSATSVSFLMHFSYRSRFVTKALTRASTHPSGCRREQRSPWSCCRSVLACLPSWHTPSRESGSGVSLRVPADREQDLKQAHEGGRPFWEGGYPLVAPQRAGPRAGIPIDPQTVAPAKIPLQGAVLLRRLGLFPPREAGQQLRERGERGVGQRLLEVL